MFGWINDCTECLVVSKFGDETWHKIKEKANCQVEDGGFLRYKYYPDSDTVQLVVAASEVLGLTVDEVLFAFGEFFVSYVQDNGYANVLECLGSNLRDWLSNLNSLHDHLQASYPKGFIAPVFWSEDDEEFDKSSSGAGKNAILVNYYSKRGSLLVPLVVGLIKRVAKVYFDIEIDMHQLQLQDEAAGINHTTWRVTSVNPNESLRLRGKRKKTSCRNDDETVATSSTTNTNFQQTFIEGGAQASFLRVKELVKRCFYNENCELFHALTLEQYIFLCDEWNRNQIHGKWCYEIWSINDGDSTSWPTLADLPDWLKPKSDDPLYFGGRIPSRGRFPPDDDGKLQSFPPKIRVVNMETKVVLDLVVPKSHYLNLEDAVFNSKEMEESTVKSFPESQDQLNNGELEVQCVVWNHETDSPYHTFAVGDLQSTSTLQLFELVSNNFDPVILMLQCVETINVDEDEEDI